MVASSISDFRYTYDGRFLCRGLVQITPGFDGKWLQGISVNIDVATKDVDPVPGRDGVSPRLHFYIDFPHQGKEHKLRLEYISMLTDSGHLRIENFSLPSSVIAHGVARHLWHRVIKAIPVEILGRIFVTGSLSSYDAKPQENQRRRDALWKDLIGLEVDPRAIFQGNCSGAQGHFSGYLYDPWNSELNRRLVCEPSRRTPLGEELPLGV
ncbi:hypothetical protein [Dechloromonas denitrificans]|uniref:hypothetical protein n=1 Tax=Dechloromonas denitrificans TaxID=281362 RepID=UPI0012F75AEA|nr:hypothetical protein [Dechloromonas denitrificans]